MIIKFHSQNFFRNSGHITHTASHILCVNLVDPEFMQKTEVNQ